MTSLQELKRFDSQYCKKDCEVNFTYIESSFLFKLFVFQTLINHLSLKCNKETVLFLLQLCNANSVWKLLFIKVLGRLPSPTETQMASEFGWRDVLYNRLIYIKKIYIERNVKRNIKPTPPALKRTLKTKGQMKNIGTLIIMYI